MGEIFMSDKTYIAPPWIKYPTYPEHSSFWKSGSGAEYLIKFNENVENMEDYLETFPKAPTFTEEIRSSDSLSEETKEYLDSTSKPIFLKLWKEDAQPKYLNDVNERNDIIFMYDTLFYDSSSHIHIGSKAYDSASEIVDLSESELKKLSSNVWDELKYTVLLNAVYYKLITDINFTNELIRTNDKFLVFKSDNLEWGVQLQDDGKYIGKNLLGLAVMEIRDVLKEIYKNYDKIDWKISGQPYSRERCACGHVHKKINYH